MTNQIVFCDESISSMDEGRAVLYLDSSKAFRMTSHIVPVDKLVKLINIWVGQADHRIDRE